MSPLRMFLTLILAHLLTAQSRDKSNDETGLRNGAVFLLGYKSFYLDNKRLLSACYLQISPLIDEGREKKIF